MDNRNYVVFLIIVFISKSVGNTITQLSLKKQVCKVSGSAVDNNVVIHTWFSRSFSNCVIECSQETLCQSVFFDKSSNLCYWNNNIPVTITTTTTCGSLLYLQLHTETELNYGCCSSYNPLAVTAQPPSSTVQPPSSTVQPPSSTVQPPSSTAQPPSSTLQPPSSTLQPPSSTVQTEEDITSSTPDYQVTEPCSTPNASVFSLLSASGISIYVERWKPQTGMNAETVCGHLCGRLVVLDTQNKQNDVQNSFRHSGGGEAYIGLRKESTWGWLKPDKALDYLNWASGPPAGGLDCAVMDSSNELKWKGVNCTESHFYICEKI